MSKIEPEPIKESMPIPPTLQAAINAASALIIAYLFIVVLMVATAQQRVSTRLAAVDTSLDYSSSSLLLIELKEQRARLSTLRATEERLTAEDQATLEKLKIAMIDFDAAWDQVAPIASRAADGALCGTPASTTADDTRARLVRARDLRQCMQEGRLPAPLAAQLTDGKLLIDLFGGQKEVSDQERRAAAVEGQLIDTRRRIEIAAKVDPVAQKVERSFAELNALTQSWLIGGSLLVQFPPSMLQIILAFASGLFGALLVTLVLVVYPKNHFSIATHGHYGARMLLGGLIAVCVYVVLSGGTAVLGTASAFADGQANYMTFCAVGVLAGMFSDRVASWLSDRATSFFRPAGETDPAKHKVAEQEIRR